jgi:uncharacterized Zn finger protein (UPF0148 family)
MNAIPEESVDALSCDIFYIDSRIKTKLTSKKSERIDALEEELKRIRWIIDKSPIITDKNIAREREIAIKKKIQDIIHDFEYAYYLLRTDDILTEYKKLQTISKPQSFVTKKGDYIISNEIKVKISRLHYNYLQISSEYIPITNISAVATQQKITVQTCTTCFSSVFETRDDGRSLCKGCGTEIEVMEDGATFKDSSRVKMAPRYKYTPDSYFVIAMNRLECKQNKDISPILPMVYREMKMQSRVAESITLQQLYNILLDLKLDDYYNDVYLIYFTITKKLIFDITSLRGELVEMHEYVSDVYEEVKDDDNHQNVYLKLFKLLQLLDYPCSREQFFYLKDIDNEDRHIKKWKQQMEILAARYPDDLTPNGKKRWRYIPSY